MVCLEYEKWPNDNLITQCYCHLAAFCVVCLEYEKWLNDNLITLLINVHFVWFV